MRRFLLYIALVLGACVPTAVAAATIHPAASPTPSRLPTRTAENVVPFAIQTGVSSPTVTTMRVPAPPMPTASPAPSPWPSPSAGQALFFGRVVDAAGSPIAGVTVSIGPPRVSALTDVAGRYELRGITVGAAGCVWMTLEMRKDGYGSLTTIDNAIEARAYAGDFQLRPGDRRHYIGPPRVELGRYPDVSRYCPAGEWIAPRVPEDTSG